MFTRKVRFAALAAANAAIIVIALFPSALPLAFAAETKDAVPVSAPAADPFAQANGYDAYSRAHPPVFTGAALEIDPLALMQGEGVRAAWDEELGREVLHTDETGRARWEFDVPRAGSYAILIRYKALPGTDGAVKRAVLLDGTPPFDEAGAVSFPRTFEDAGPIRSDPSGNDLRPAQREVFVWNTAAVRDVQGYFGDRLLFRLEAGRHTLELAALQEPMALSMITLESVERTLPSYEDTLRRWGDENIKAAKGALENGLLVIEAENSFQKSSQTVYPVNDASSAATSPQSADRQKLNCIGGARWQDAGDWISWTLKVPRSGLYRIGFRFLQNFSSDTAVGRKLTIDGAVPFAEAAALPFYYDGKFQVALAGDGEPYLFYLEEGSRELRLEVTPGPLSELLVAVSGGLGELNRANWQLLTLLGASPDLYKSYFIEEALPEVMDILAAQTENFRALAERWRAMTAQTDSNVSQLEQMAFKLGRMVEDPNRIPSMYVAFKDDLGALGNMLVAARTQPLLLDTVFLAEENARLPRANAGFFGALRYELQRLLSSYFKNYNSIDVARGDSDQAPITVWIGNGITGGRDQALALNQLIIQDFTARQGIPVNLQLVPGGTILTATLAGMGPDLALSLPGGEPVNYAMRGAVSDLSKMDGFDEVVSRFPAAAYRSFQYLGGVYAIPETLSFPMMFYRTDILASLGIDPARLETWQDVVDVLPLIQRRNMNFALPASFGTYAMFLFQNGGGLYADGGRKSALGSREALDAFHNYVRFYSDYTTPYAYSFEMRFRTGEIPLGIADYTTYNLLQISAPEIQGRWAMSPVPGTRRADGTVDRTAPASGGGCVLMASSGNPDGGWEFIRWWTDADCQVSFGKELESVMGPAARYNTANLEAIARIPWQAADRARLTGQMAALQGIPEVPGGYMTSRSVDFAIRRVYNENAESRSALLSYIGQIDQEIRLKREEFGLD